MFSSLQDPRSGKHPSPLGPRTQPPDAAEVCAVQDVQIVDIVDAAAGVVQLPPSFFLGGGPIRPLYKLKLPSLRMRAQRTRSPGRVELELGGMPPGAISSRI